MRPIENDAVNASDFRIAVSNALVAHWRERYGYSGDAHTVIPCTLGTGEVARRSVDPLGRPNSAIRLVYSGSTAGWQSFELLEKLLTRIMDAQPDVHVLFLSERDAHNEALKTRYPGRVEVKWVAANEVADVLRSCDAGILVREDTITNRVASPTKFAEYLSAGIPVIISEHLGDFSALVAKEGLGMVIKDGAAILSLNSLPTAERERLSRFASGHFDKAAFSEAYRRLLECLAGSP